MGKQKTILGVTGGVGSGKSTVLDILQENYDAVVCRADDLGHETLEKDSVIYNEIIKRYGNEITDDKGNLNRNKLAEIIFQDENEKKVINGLIHPYVIEKIKKEVEVWVQGMNEQANRNINLFVIETALMFESGCDKICDKVIGITCDEKVRIQRLMETRGYTKEKTLSIIKSQEDERTVLNKCDAVITNNGSKDELKEQIERTIKKIF